MNLDLYRYLTAVEQTRNITKAAEMLHISQPALTKAIHRQEKELGVTIFDRSVTPLRLTYAGERFFMSVRRILEIENSMNREMQSIASGARERLCLGISTERGAVWLYRILPEFTRHFPDVELKVFEGYNAEFESRLLSGELDLCISTLPVMSGELTYQAVSEGPVYVIASSSHPLASRADLLRNSPLRPQYIEPDALNGQDFLLLHPEQGMGRIARQILEKYALSVNCVMELGSQRTLALLAASGMGMAFSTYNSALLAQSRTDLHPVFFTVEDPMYYRKNVIVFKKNRVQSPALRALIEISVKVLLGTVYPAVTIRR